MKILENILISKLTTMRLGGPARFVIEVSTPEEVREAYHFARAKHLPVWIMGGGANTIGRAKFDGVVILNKLRGIEPLTETSQDLTLKGYGGEIWDDFVEFACEKGFSGIEAMSLIPGTLGAAPVQNIGAYGQDISQVIESAEVYDTQTDEFLTLSKEEMGLSYRKTRFNSGVDAGRFFILAVAVRLKKTHLTPPFYTSLQAYLNERGITDYSPMTIRNAVIEIRNSKLPDPLKVASAGSFFKNVNLAPEEVPAAEEKGILVWKNPDGSGKVNSGWLIEQAGLKGKQFHGFEVSDKAALVLINRSAKDYSDLAAARQEIIDTVREKFGFTLEQEPVEIPEAINASTLKGDA